VSSPLCRSARPLPLPPSFLYLGARALFPFSSVRRSAKLARPSSRPLLSRRCWPPGLPPPSAARGCRLDPSPPPLFSPYGLTPASPKFTGHHALPRCLPSLMSARRCLLLAGRRRQSPTATATTVMPQTRVSPLSVGGGASHPHQALSRRNHPASRLCSEPVRSKCCALHQQWPSPTPHLGH
jgi:hypothetical protein